MVWSEGKGLFSKEVLLSTFPLQPFCQEKFREKTFWRSLLSSWEEPPQLEMSENWPLTRREEREKGQNDLFWQKKEGLTGNRLLAIKLLLEKRGKCLPFDISGVGRVDWKDKGENRSSRKFFPTTRSPSKEERRKTRVNQEVNWKWGRGEKEGGKLEPTRKTGSNFSPCSLPPAAEAAFAIMSKSHRPYSSPSFHYYSKSQGQQREEPN